MKEPKRCTCGRSEEIFCPRCSKVRMVIALKNGNDNLKWQAPNGNLYNPVWYSKLKYNRMDVYRIVNKMEESFKKSTKYTGVAQVLMFYINGNRHHHIKKVPV